MSPQELEHEEKGMRFNVRLHSPGSTSPEHWPNLDGELKAFRLHAAAKRYYRLIVPRGTVRMRVPALAT